MVDVIENKEFLNKRYSRRKVRDSCLGADEIKRGGTIYLPMPAGFKEAEKTSYSSPSTRIDNPQDFDSIDLPWAHSNPVYSDYCQRARYPELVLLSRNGLIGTAMKKEHKIELPSSISYMFEDAGRDGESITEIFADMIAEVLTVGNVFPVVDVDENTNLFRITLVKAENYVDWDESKSGLEYAGLKMRVNERDFKTLQNEEIIVTYAYHFDENKNVIVDKTKDGEKEKPIELSKQGVTFKEMPIFPAGSIVNKSYPQPALLDGLSEICLAIYRKDADLTNAEYMTCNPNLVISGADDSEDAGVPNIVGSQVALLLSNSDAKAYYPNTDTSALDHMSQVIQHLFEEAALYCISIIGADKKAAESFDTVKTRQGMQNATLITVVENCAKALKNALRFCARYSGANENDVIFEPNLDFSSNYVSPDLLKVLIDLWAQKGYSLESLLSRLKEANLLDKDRTVEQEIAAISTEPPAI